MSHLAREIGVSRPLLHVHLQRLEAAGLIVGSLELSEEGKAMKYYEVADFDLRLTATTLAEAAKTLTKKELLMVETKEQILRTVECKRSRRTGTAHRTSWH